jgi:hypothetical protein
MSHLTRRNRGCRTAPAAPTGPAPDAVLVGDAGGHDGTGRDSDEAVCQTTTAATDPPLSRLSHSSQQLPQVLCQTQICSTPQSPWETPEVTTVRAAIRTKRCVRQQQLRLTHRYRGCRTAPAAPTGFVPNPDLQHATIPVGDAGGHDGTGRNSEDGDPTACFEILKALRPPPPTGDAGCYR